MFFLFFLIAIHVCRFDIISQPGELRSRLRGIADLTAEPVRLIQSLPSTPLAYMYVFIHRCGRTGCDGPE